MAAVAAAFGAARVAVVVVMMAGAAVPGRGLAAAGAVLAVPERQKRE